MPKLVSSPGILVAIWHIAADPSLGHMTHNAHSPVDLDFVLGTNLENVKSFVRFYVILCLLILPPPQCCYYWHQTGLTQDIGYQDPLQQETESICNEETLKSALNGLKKPTKFLEFD